MRLSCSPLLQNLACNKVFKWSKYIINILVLLNLKLFIVQCLIVTCSARPKSNFESELSKRVSEEGDNEIENTYEYDDTGGGIYDKVESIIYPYQQYIQVRKSYSVEHLPYPAEEYDSNYNNEEREHSSSPSSPLASVRTRGSKSKSRSKSQPSNLLTSATNHHHDRGEHDDQYDHGTQSSYSYGQPKLREEIENYKKQEVYEEKGYSDGAYDHGGHGSRSQYHHEVDHHNEPSINLEHSPTTRGSIVLKRPSKMLAEPTSTRLLEYASSNLYDKDAHEKGIYAAREHIYCPEVIDFDMSDKKMRMGEGGDNPRGQRPRLTGLGSKIKCLKEKYFGAEPLPSKMFMEPSESRHSVIDIPTFDQFYRSVRHEVDSISSFQHF